jgi:two-component system sensor histidine kinase KdpD
MALGRTRTTTGLVLSLVLPAALTMVLVPMQGRLNLVSDMLLFLLVTVVVALVGGMLPALVSAVVGSALLNYWFTPPLHTLSIRDTNNTLALVVFLVVAILVSTVVDVAARRTRQAARAAAEAATLADLASGALDEGDALNRMLDRLRSTFALTSATLLERRDGVWVPVAGDLDEALLERADHVVPANDHLRLALGGGRLRAGDERVVEAFAVQAAAVLERTRLGRAAAEAAALAEVDRTRTALLAAVGHDLRTPLAAAKAAVSSLRSDDVTLDRRDRGELLATADESLDRLAGLVANLLDMSRLQAGAMSVHPQPTAVDEVLARVLDDLAPAGRRVRVDLPDDLPPATADPGLLERVLANVVDNALHYSPPERPPALTGRWARDRVEIRIVDHGPGIPVQQRDRVFLPFQRLGDTDNTQGVGLGLALSRGLAEAMGGTLDPEETPGGGLTLVLSLAAAEPGETEPGHRERARAVET